MAIKPFRVTAREARANIAGLNIVFGAVLGFVLASTETMITRDYIFTLFTSATLATVILYVSHSKHRLVYAAIGIGFVSFLPDLLNEQFFSDASRIPEKLQPTFAVWLMMTLLVEFWPRVPEPTTSARADEAEI